MAQNVVLFTHIVILSFFVQGKLLYCHPPPDVDSVTFNHAHTDLDLGAGVDAAQQQVDAMVSLT